MSKRMVACRQCGWFFSNSVPFGNSQQKGARIDDLRINTYMYYQSYLCSRNSEMRNVKENWERFQSKPNEQRLKKRFAHTPEQWTQSQKRITSHNGFDSKRFRIVPAWHTRALTTQHVKMSLAHLLSVIWHDVLNDGRKTTFCIIVLLVCTNKIRNEAVISLYSLFFPEIGGTQMCNRTHTHIPYAHKYSKCLCIF